MKEVTQYQCEICNTFYNDAVKCQECESSHCLVDHIAQYKYNPKGMGPESKYPHALVVIMENGQQLTFKR